MTNDSEHYKQQLSKQLGFIGNSCELFDQGNKEEAIRIATNLRVLFHDTAKSTSLTTHLGIKDTIKILTTTPGIPKPEKGKYAAGWAGFSLSLNGVQAPLGSGSHKNYIPVLDWWEMTLHSLSPDNQLRRRDIVLEATNRDGGAHVDSPGNLNQYYVQLSRSTSIGTLVVNDVSVPLPDVHLIHLRQFGYEVLNSPDLLSITESGDEA